MWWTFEFHPISHRVLTFTLEMIGKGKVYSKDPVAADAEVLTMETEIVKKWLRSERIKFTKLDNSLFEKFYKVMDSYENPNSNNPWQKNIDEPERRVFWRIEEGQETYSILTDTIMEGPLVNLVATFEQFHILADVFETFFDLQWRRRIGESAGLVYTKQKLPWPLSDRDMCFHLTGVTDLKNKAIVNVSQSLPIGAKYYDSEVPPAAKGLERIDLNLCFNLFQYLGPNKCRHLSIVNTDPKIPIIPTSLVNHVCGKILANNTMNTKQMVETLQDPKNKFHGVLNGIRKPYYAYVEEGVTTNGDCRIFELLKKHG